MNTRCCPATTRSRVDEHHVDHRKTNDVVHSAVAGAESAKGVPGRKPTPPAASSCPRHHTIFDDILQIRHPISTKICTQSYGVVHSHAASRARLLDPRGPTGVSSGARRL